MRVLVVLEDAALIEQIRSALSLRGHQVSLADRNAEVTSAEFLAVDLIIADPPQLDDLFKNA